MQLPTIAHIVYIPTVLTIGIAIGYALGGRADKDADAARRRAEESKAARRAARDRGASGDGANPE